MSSANPMKRDDGRRFLQNSGAITCNLTSVRLTTVASGRAILLDSDYIADRLDASLRLSASAGSPRETPF
jgi:hypothetical protein